jgi:hypothetical protein
MPPCGTTIVAPIPSEIPAAVAEPTMHGGMMRSGLRAANGIAPSVMNVKPRTQADLPASRSSGSHRLRNRTVASGGVMPATMTAAIGSVTPVAMRPTAKASSARVRRQGAPRCCPACCPVPS